MLVECLLRLNKSTTNINCLKVVNNCLKMGFSTTSSSPLETSESQHIENPIVNNTAAMDEKASPIVNIKQGKLRGIVETLYDGSSYYSYKGIPYGQAPVGKLRFKAPLPALPWTGILEANNDKKICPQIDLTAFTVVEGDEDCLILNVYTKSLTKKKPVMVFIHGGGFMSGSCSSQMYGPKYLLQHDVVLVTINYRIEVFGFLCLDTEDVPGNAGMRDQVLALKWIRDNIKYFGGDPSNVTIFGESAGSASVSYHLVSPLSKGLFHKAICQSGVCLNDWAFGVDGRDRAFRVGKALGKDTKHPKELLEFLQDVPAKDLIKMTFKTATPDEKQRGMCLCFVPVVEKIKNNAFLPETPLDLLMRNKINVPLVIGYNSSEGILSLMLTLKKLDFYNKNLGYKLTREIFLNINETQYKNMTERLRQFYFDNKDMTGVDDIDKIADLETDMSFSYGIHRFAHFYAKNKAPTYFYRLDLVSDMNITKNIAGRSDMKGMSHADDLFYLFNNKITSDIYEKQERVRKMVYTLTKLWTDFAKTGDPTPDKTFNVKWLPFTNKSKEYLDLNETPSMKKKADNERIEFWNKLYSESGLPCITRSTL